METDKMIKKLLSITQSEKEHHCYVILDAAMHDKTYDRLKEGGIDCLSLFVGEKANECAEVAPYLIRLSENRLFTNWLMDYGWGENWGIFLSSSLSIKALKKHFRNFLIVYNEDGRSLYFRYYDPRILRTFLNAANREEIDLFFGPIHSFFSGNEGNNHMIQYERVEGQLYQHKIL